MKDAIVLDVNVKLSVFVFTKNTIVLDVNRKNMKIIHKQAQELDF
jgi:hypothetical protein